MRPPREDSLPWYKQFWPWFLISLPASVVIAAMVTIVIAIRTDDGLVSDDYYREGLAVHKHAASTARARELGIVARVDYLPQAGRLRIHLNQPLPAGSRSMVLRVTHPTLPGQDQEIALTLLAKDVLGGQLTPLGPAHWKLRLHPADKAWRIEGRLKLPVTTSTQLD